MASKRTVSTSSAVDLGVLIARLPRATFLTMLRVAGLTKDETRELLRAFDELTA